MSFLGNQVQLTVLSNVYLDLTLLHPVNFIGSPVTARGSNFHIQSILTIKKFSLTFNWNPPFHNNGIIFCPTV